MSIIKQKERGSLVVISGPSGAGKDTVVAKYLRKRSSNAWLSVSCTSRDMRPGDKEGKSYYFLSKEEFEQKISEVIEGKIDKKSIEKGGFFSLNGTCTLRRLWLNIIIFIICLQILLRVNYLMINYLPNYFDFVISPYSN